METHSRINDQARFVPPATHRLQVASSGRPRDFYFLLLHNTTMLAIAAAIEPLRVANQVSGKTLYRWFSVTEGGGAARCSNQMELNADMALFDVPRQARVLVCTGAGMQSTIDKKLVDWLRRHAIHGGQLGSVCAGVFALAEAGLLDRQRFTLHWENVPVFRERFPTLEPTDRRYEISNGLMSCGGGHAATDMMLEQIERDHGRDLAVYVADMCNYVRTDHRVSPQRSSVAAVMGSRNPSLIAALRFMQDNLEDNFSIGEIAAHAAISSRQLERLCKRHLGRSPLKVLSDLRIARAYALLNETDLSVSEIAAAVGLSGSGMLTRKFRARFGVCPRDYRRGWIDIGQSAQRANMSDFG